MLKPNIDNNRLFYLVLMKLYNMLGHISTTLGWSLIQTVIVDLCIKIPIGSVVVILLDWCEVNHRLKSKTLKLIFVVPLLSNQHKEGRTMTGWIMCLNGATSLLRDCCFSYLGL